MTYNVFGGTLSLTQSINQSLVSLLSRQTNLPGGRETPRRTTSEV